METQGAATMSTAPETMGALLLKAGKILAEDADRIVMMQKKEGLKFGDAAVKLGLVSPEDVEDCLAQQFDFNGLSFEDCSVSRSVLSAFHATGTVMDVLRGIRSQLLLRWFTEHKQLVVAPINSKDGASFMAANLAVLFSQLGQKTLLIDANFRNPAQNELFKYVNRKGLSDWIVGRTDGSVISSFHKLPFLDVLSAGTRPPNPLELLSGARFSKVLNECAEAYDVMVLDAPALSQYEDAIVLAQKCRGLVSVARVNKTPIKQMDAATTALSQHGITPLGVILNHGRK